MTLQQRTAIASMVESQLLLNDVMRPGWRNENIKWFRAIWTEAAEGVNHLGWEWWKNIPANIEQARLELVDILHFSISNEIRAADFDDETVVDLLGEGLAEADGVASIMVARYGSESLSMLIERVAFEALHSHYGHPPSGKPHSVGVEFFKALFGAMVISGMDFPAVSRLYLGKNTLNMFRQNNGDKQREYPRIWADGREDNEHLTEVSNLYQPDNMLDLYTLLTERFMSLHPERSINPLVL